MYEISRIKGRLGNGKVLLGSAHYFKGKDKVFVDISIVQRDKKFCVHTQEYISEAYPEDGIILNDQTKNFNSLEEAFEYVKKETIVKIEAIHF